MKTLVEQIPFVVSYLWTEECYIVLRGGIHAGLPQFFSKRENAQRQADWLNKTNGLIKEVTA